MTPGRGWLLVAAQPLVDGDFDRTVIFLLEHAPAGAVGVVVNRPSDTPVDDALPGWEPLSAEPPVMFVGGPVEPDTAIGVGVANRPDLPGWSQVIGSLGTVDLHEEPSALTAGLGPLRLFAGYAGWGPGQLAAELDVGAWVVAPSLPEDVFGDPTDRWRQVLRRQGGRTAWLANAPPDPRLN